MRITHDQQVAVGFSHSITPPDQNSRSLFDLVLSDVQDPSSNIAGRFGSIQKETRFSCEVGFLIVSISGSPLRLSLPFSLGQAMCCQIPPTAYKKTMRGSIVISTARDHEKRDASISI
jgi:hypothetical protein